jgi:hypothetical protein
MNRKKSLQGNSGSMVEMAIDLDNAHRMLRAGDEAEG